MIKKHFYVVSGTYEEYSTYKRNRQPQEPETLFLYVHDFTILLGLDEIDGCFYGTYESRKDIDVIKSRINIIKNKQPVSITSVANGTSYQDFGTITASNFHTAGFTTSPFQEIHKRLEDLEKKIADLTSKNTTGPAGFSL